MNNDKGPGSTPKKSRGGEQFADPLNWNPDNRSPGPPVARSRGGGDPSEQREKDLNKRILEEYGAGPLDAFKPIIAGLLVGLIVFSQVDRSNMLNAVIYSGMAMAAAGSVYVMVARDTLPPLISMLFKACFILGLIAVALWFIVNHSDVFKPSDSEKPRYKETRDPTAQ